MEDLSEPNKKPVDQAWIQAWNLETNPMKDIFSLYYSTMEFDNYFQLF